MPPLTSPKVHFNTLKHLYLSAFTKNFSRSEMFLGYLRVRFKTFRSRGRTGISDNVEVVQSQETLATANLDYINSVFAHNLAKVSLARALGRAAEALPKFLKIQ